MNCFALVYKCAREQMYILAVLTVQVLYDSRAAVVTGVVTSTEVVRLCITFHEFSESHLNNQLQSDIVQGQEHTKTPTFGGVNPLQHGNQHSWKYTASKMTKTYIYSSL